MDLLGIQPMPFVFITVCQENTDISHFACCSIYAFYEWFKPIGRTVIHIDWTHISTYMYVYYRPSHICIDLLEETRFNVRNLRAPTSTKYL